MNSSYTTVQLSIIEAKQFIDFQKHYALIGMLDSIKAFEIKNGTVKIHFDSKGQIAKLEKQEFYSL